VVRVLWCSGYMIGKCCRGLKTQGKKGSEGEAARTGQRREGIGGRRKEILLAPLGCGKGD